jgi:archaellum component FlaF (FlaF/FlaG flagellin family)
LSFFDEADEPRTAQRPSSRSRRPPGGGRRPPSDHQAIQVRRAVAVVAIIIAIVLIVLGVHSCQVSATNNALKDYNNNVNSLLQESNNTGAQLFKQLSGGGGASNATALRQEISQTRMQAEQQLAKASTLSVPDQVKNAQARLLLLLAMRADGITNIDGEIEQALNSATSKGAIDSIAAEMARFYASDVVYHDYTAPLINTALVNALGKNNGETFNSGQFLNSLGWLTPNYVATKLGASLPTLPTAKCVRGKLYGHSLNSVSVSGTTLQTGSTNTIAASPATTFTLNFTNGGSSAEANVKLKVSVSGTSVKGEKTVPETRPGQTLSVPVTLSSTPPTGTFQVAAEVVPVHCETDTANNTLTFPVTFQ